MEEPEYKSTKEIRTIDRVTQSEVIYLKAVITDGCTSMHNIHSSTQDESTAPRSSAFTQLNRTASLHNAISNRSLQQYGLT